MTGSKAIKKRAWIKNAAIIFLIAMLILTLFSNTIMNYSLPEVSAQYSSSGTITTRVKVTGDVKAYQDYEVSITESRTIKEIKVRKGDPVSIGDILFLLEDGDSSEIKTMIKTYEEKKLTYDKKLLDLYPDNSADVRAISKLRNDLTKYKSEKSLISDSLASLDKKNDELTKLQDEYDKLKEQKPSINEEYDSSGKTNAQKLNEYKNLLNEANNEYIKLENQVTILKNNLDKAEDNLYYNTITLNDAKTALDDYKAGSGSSGNITEDSLISQQRALEKLEIARWRAIEEYDKINIQWQNELKNLYDAYISATESYQIAYLDYQNGRIDESTFKDAEKKLQEAEKAYSEKQTSESTNLIQQKRAIEDLDIQIRDAKADLEKAQKEYDKYNKNDVTLNRLTQAVKDAESNDRNINREITVLKNDITKAEKEYSKAGSDVDKYQKEVDNYGKLSVKDTIDMEMIGLDDTIKKIKGEISDIKREILKNTTIEINFSPSNEYITITDFVNEQFDKKIDATQDEINNKQDEINSKYSDIQIKKDKMDLENMEKELKEMEEDIEKAREKTLGNEIKAKIAGIITSIDVVAGNDVKPGDKLATIQVVDKGYYMEQSVTNEQASRIKPGDKAAPQYYWGPELNAVVSTIRNDPNDPSKRKLITIDISGIDSPMTNLTLMLGEKGQNYDTIVPLSAIREDSNGKFILVVESKSTPLGNRYKASRIDIQILAEDETSAAISSVLYGNEFIITASTKPLQDGDQVRLVNR